MPAEHDGEKPHVLMFFSILTSSLMVHSVTHFSTRRDLKRVLGISEAPEIEHWEIAIHVPVGL